MSKIPKPPPYAIDEQSLRKNTEIETFTAGGPGGQHRNKTQNAVRLHHLESGLVVTATERRSLEANRRAAFERLIVRLEKLNQVRRPRVPTRPSRSQKARRIADKARAAQKKANRQKIPKDE